MSIVTRFAPSPTGYLHLGHAASASFAWTRARDAGGRFLLRIEDIDPTRCRPEFTAAILEDLAWLGLDWDGAVRVQSEHLAEYRDSAGSRSRAGPALPLLLHARRHRARDGRQRGGAARAGRGASIPAPAGAWRRRSGRRASRPASASRCGWTWRAALGASARTLTFHEAARASIACDPNAFGDVVLARKDAPASYHLCVTP